MASENIESVLIKYMDEHGYDGLYLDDDCGCLKDDLAPCGSLGLGCSFGWKHPARKTDANRFGHAWIVNGRKGKR